MVEVKKEGIVLDKTVLDFENEGVLNPAVIYDKGVIHLFYRAVAHGNHSSIGYCTLSDPFTVDQRSEVPILSPEFDYESHGIEDPRIVKIDDLFYLTYTSYDGVNALGTLATSKDLVNFERKGIIVPKTTLNEFKTLLSESKSIIKRYCPWAEITPTIEGFIWDKNIVFFPRKINGKFFILHRIKPDIQIISIDNLDSFTPEFWNEFLKNIKSHTLFTPTYPHEISYIGGGCPPIETEHGWLMIYHGVHDSGNGNVYSACAALLDLNDPTKLIAKLPYPLFQPEFHWELKGEVNNVCFPTGAIVIGEQLYIYYGAADERIACASVVLSELLTDLLINQ